MTGLPDLRIMLVDDHSLFLEGLNNLLSSEGIPVVGTAHDGYEALARARQVKPDVILMDIHMPRCDGLSATRLIKAELPEIKIVILTMSEDDEDLFDAVRSGASGYLIKSLDADAFFDYLEDLQAGHPPFSPGLAEKILHAFAGQAAQPREDTPDGQDNCAQDDQLSPRQMQILTLVAQGQTYRHIAETLNISESTVKYHMGEILECLHLHNRAQVIAYAARMGLSRAEG